MKRALATLALIPTLALTACAATIQPDFDDDAHRAEVLHEYVCQQMEEQDPGLIYSAAGREAAENATGLDKSEIIREQLMAIRMELTPSCDPTSVGNFPWLVPGLTAWLDSSFDYQTAKEAGLV